MTNGFDTTPECRPTLKGAFLRRVVRFLAAEAGIGRFLDIGSGLSARGNVHQIVPEAGCRARVLYVDNHPDVVARSRALLDPGQPVALTLFGILHFISEEEDPAGIAALLRGALPPGSYLALSHFCDTSTSHPADAAQIAATQKLLRDLLGPVNWRSREEILRYFGDLELITPGLVPLPEWRPTPRPTSYQYAGHHSWVGAVARKR